jgi:hypothetical protein
MYLRCLAGDRTQQWLQWLPWAEYCYNTNFHSSLRLTPFSVVYGREPPSLRAYTQGEARLPVVHQQLMERDEFICQVQERLEQAQNHYKLQYDRNHRELKFHPGYWGSGCASFIALSPHSMSLVGVNWVLSSTTLFKCANALVTSPTSSCYHPEPSCMIPFMSSCSRSSTVQRPQVLEFYHRFTTAALAWSPHK